MHGFITIHSLRELYIGTFAALDLLTDSRER